MREFKMYGIVGTSVETGETVYYDNDCGFCRGVNYSNTADYLVKPYLTTELGSAKSAKTRSTVRYQGRVENIRIVEVDLNYNL